MPPWLRGSALALSGLDEVAAFDLRGLGRTDDVTVTIDTGYGLSPIGREHDESWREDFELGDDGTFELHVWDGRSKRASLTGRIVDGSEACDLLGALGAVDPEECQEDYRESVLSIEYVRVQPEYRGKNYSVRLVDAAVHGFGRQGRWVYADCYSQRIYANLRQVLPAPRLASSPDGFNQWNPTDAQVLEHLDPLPVEGTASYRGYGYRLANEQHVEVLWKL